MLDPRGKCRLEVEVQDPRSVLDVRQAGSVCPLVSWPKGNSSKPTTKASEVSATGVPMVWKCATPAPTKNVNPAPRNLPTEVAKANALPRHSVGYCSGNQSVYMAKLAPPRPRKNRHTKNRFSVPVGK